MTPEHVATIPAKLVGIAGTGVTWSTVILGMIETTLAGGAVAIVKNWPKLKEIAVGRANHLDDERRVDMDEMRADVKQLKRDGERNRMILSYVMPALTIVMAELRRLDPENAGLKQARDLMAMANSGDFGLGQYIADLAVVTGQRRDEAKPE